MKATVIINEQHSMLPDQVRVMDTIFGSGEWDEFPVPAAGWSYSEMLPIAGSLIETAETLGTAEEPFTVVFLSPVPAMLKLLAKRSGMEDCRFLDVCVFHNDKREAKELPNGKVIHTVAKTGWILV